MNPFDYVNAINYSKKDIMQTRDDEKAYSPYMVNRSLSYFQDTVVLANEMNKYHHLDGRLQFDFLINTIRKRNRFSKWNKSSESEDINAIKSYYGYSNEKARDVLPLLSKANLNTIKGRIQHGGTQR